MKTIKEYLKNLGFKSNKIRQLLRFGAVMINGKIIKRYDHPVHDGDRVVIKKRSEDPEILKRFNIKILYEDDAIIVIEKPLGLLSISTDTEKKKTAYYVLNEYLRQKNQRVFIVHRLDRDTSGIMVFAKTEQAKKRLQTLWKEVKKTYLALVEGKPENPEGIIKSSLKETDSFLVHESHSPGAKLSITSYRILKSGKDYSLLECNPITGRKNQIRVHLSSIGHPVAGDKKYGAKTNPFKRLCLHSWRLSFKHPVTLAEINFETRPPEWSRMI